MLWKLGQDVVRAYYKDQKRPKHPLFLTFPLFESCRADPVCSSGTGVEHPFSLVAPDLDMQGKRAVFRALP
jgi:hypothetical protein